MRLVACPSCRLQYDVSGHDGPSVRCSCGRVLPLGVVKPVDAEVRRCGSCGALLADGATSCEYCRAAVIRDGELSLLCPECYARNLADSRFCTACGVEFRPVPVPERSDPVACVRCGREMETRRIGGVTVHECAGCHGLWVPGTSFDDLVNRAIEAWKASEEGAPVPEPRRTGGNPVAERVEYRKCPECGCMMDRRNYRRTSGVIIDRCNEHGTWLDADELERIAGFILSGGIERAKNAESTTMRVQDGLAPPRRTRASADFERVFREHQPGRARVSPVLESVGELFSRLIDRLL